MMKLLHACVLLLLFFSATSAQKTIWQILGETPSYSLLRMDYSRKAQGIVPLLNDHNGNYTLFAPIEEAMYDAISYTLGLSATEMQKLLNYHIASGALPTSYLSTQYVVQSAYAPASMGNRPQRIAPVSTNGTNVNVASGTIVNPDTLAVNGMIQGISNLLPFPNVTVMAALRAQQPATFTTVIGALTSLGVNATLVSDGGWTFFAPTDSAFAAFQQAQPAVYQAIISDPPTFTKFLKYHISSTLVYAGEYPLTSSSVTSLAGTSFAINKTANQMTINGVSVQKSNILCSNGVLHVVDTLLVPPDFVPNLRVILRGQGLTTLISQFDANGLGNLLDDTTQNHTIYAPTNAAFSAVLPSALNANTLAYHMTDDLELLADRYDGHLEFSHVHLTSLLGQAQVFKISRTANSTLYVNSAKVLSGDYKASNGIIHIIDRVLSLPLDLPSILKSRSDFSTLTKFLNASGLLTGGLTTSAGLTLFAPNDTAFSLVDPQVLRYLGKPLATSVLQNVLSYHVINGATAGNTIYYRQNIPSGSNSVPTLTGEAITIVNSANSVKLNNVSDVTSVDTLAANGVLHAVNRVVLPPSFVFDLSKALVGVDAQRFLALVSNSSLASLLTGSAPYTVFAPTDAALAALPSSLTADALLQVLQYHFVAGTVLSGSLTNGQVVPTLLYPAGLGGAAQVLRFNVSASYRFVNMANITMPNNTAINGVVHVIDRVLMPPGDIATLLASTPSFSVFNTLLAASGLTSLVTGVNTTLFVPDNTGFTGFDAFTIRYLQRPSMLPILQNIIRYHVVLSNVLYSASIPMGTSSVTLANNVTVTVFKSTAFLSINGVNVTRSDIMASNGVVHVLRTAVIPNMYNFGVIQALAKVNATTFLDLADKAGIAAYLASPEKHTVFAPSDKGFAAVELMPTGADLVQLLKYHIVNGSFITSTLQDRQLLYSNLNLTTLRNNAQRLRVTIDPETGAMGINNVTIQIHNELATNGVVHRLEKVLFPPPDILSRAGQLPQNCSTFVYAAQFAGLAAVFKRPGLTSFIPTNQAFRGLPKNLFKYLMLGSESSQDLNAVLTYHLINQYLIYSPDFPVGTRQYQTQLGQPIILGTLTGPNNRRILRANDANVVFSALASNGVIHVVDEVLIPPYFEFTLKKLLTALDSDLFRKYLTKAKLNEYILSTDPVTFFVPTDKAFTEDTPKLDKLQRNELVQIMANHIVRGKYDTIEPGDKLLTVSGRTLVVSGDPNSNNLFVTLEGNVKEATLAFVIDGAANPALNGDAYQINHVLVREGNDHLEPGTIASVVLLSLLAAVVLVGFAAYVYKQVKDPSYSQLG